jgi:hypothetical protein
MPEHGRGAGNAGVTLMVETFTTEASTSLMVFHHQFKAMADHNS